jgi:hypothetical protein
METDVNSANETLTRFVQAISRDQVLLQRFSRMARMSRGQRADAIHLLAEQMAATRQDPKLAAAFRLFADARVFDATMAALRECGYLED